MNSGGNQSDWLVSERTRFLLGQLDTVLRKASMAEDLQLRVMALDILDRGGKRLRPALVFLSAGYGQREQSALLHAGAALELLHIASLYHDDVMDRAPLRRGGSSANAHWGNSMATLTGTFLFARASALLASLGTIPNQLVSKAMVDLCTGQLQEMENAYNLHLTEEDHLSILARKTGTLFELPCHLGALLSDSSAVYKDALTTYGRNLGLAFQLTDDALDLVGQSSQMGKATGTDLREGVYSLPVLRLLRQDSDLSQQLRTLLGQVRLTEEHVHEALALVQRSAVVEDVLAMADGYARKAQAALDVLPDGPARISLLRLVEYVITRSS